MILDTIEAIAEIEPLHPQFAAVRAFIAGGALDRLAPGRHEVDGRGGYAVVSEYVPRPPEECVVESHVRYIDIHIMARGRESIGVCAAGGCERVAYDEPKDFQTLRGTCDFLTLEPGRFAVFFPRDAHQPGVRCGEAVEPVLKIVFKIPVLEK
jgi:biofilm protein TabA